VVTLYFPPAGAPAAPAAAETQAPSPPPSGAGAATVLLVDDNEEVRATTATYLRDGGLSVIEAPDAAAALRLLTASAVDAVVSDIVMPGELDGMGLAEAIRASRPGLPVLLISGFSQRAADAHARGFPVISKPYSMPDLERRLRLLVEPPAVAKIPS
jgi:CheY-like chemotaxis protein